MYTVKELIDALKQCPPDFTVKIYADKSHEICAVGFDVKTETVDLFTKTSQGEA